MPCGLSHCQLLGYFAASVSLAPALLAVLWLQLLDLWSDPTYSGPNGESGALSGLTGSCSGPDAIKLDVSWCRVCPSVLLPGHQQVLSSSQPQHCSPPVCCLQVLTGIGAPSNSMLSMEGFSTMEGTYGRFIDR